MPDLLVFSRVARLLQASFAVMPRMTFVTGRGEMGRPAVGRLVAALAWAATALITAPNLKLNYGAATGIE